MDLSAIEQDLYGDIAGYSLSLAGRAKIERELDPTLTYGEVTPACVVRMLAKAEAAPGEVFYDLGSGSGKAVIFAALQGMGRAVGIELIPELHEAADMVRRRYDERVRPNHAGAGEVAFRNGDMFAADIADADVVFSHCTCFENETMQKLANKVEELKSGSRVITVTKSLPSAAFRLTGSELLSFAWGDATVYYHVRL